MQTAPQNASTSPVPRCASRSRVTSSSNRFFAPASGTSGAASVNSSSTSHASRPRSASSSRLISTGIITPYARSYAAASDVGAGVASALPRYSNKPFDTNPSGPGANTTSSGVAPPNTFTRAAHVASPGGATFAIRPSPPPTSSPPPNRSTDHRCAASFVSSGFQVRPSSPDTSTIPRSPTAPTRPSATVPTASRSTSPPLLTRVNHCPSGERAMKPPSPVSTQVPGVGTTSEGSGCVAPGAAVVTPPSRQRYTLPSPPSTTTSPPTTCTLASRAVDPKSSSEVRTPTTRPSKPRSP